MDDLIGDFDFDAQTEAFDYATKEGWRDFVDLSLVQPLRISMDEYESLDSSDRAIYNLGRERFRTVGARISTPSLRNAATAIRSAMSDNRSPDASKSGVIISGRPHLGKTTAVQEFARAFERARRRHDAGAMPSRIPVAYVPVPTHATAKTMIRQLADFYAVVYSQTASYDTLLTRVSHVMRECATELVIIDDIHRLDLHYSKNEQVADALKELSERCPGTMVYAGVDVARNGLFWGPRGEQILARFELVRFDPFELAKGREAEWGSLLLDLEDSLCLLNQPPGAIKTAARELHDLSRGSIGRLAKALRRGAREAVERRTERVDLDDVLMYLARLRDAEAWVDEEKLVKGSKPRRGRPAKVLR